MKIFSPEKLDKLMSDPLMKQSGVAKAVGISSAGLSRIRSGHKNPSVNTLARIAYVLKKPIEYFFEEEGNAKQQHLPLKDVANG